MTQETFDKNSAEYKLIIERNELRLALKRAISAMNMVPNFKTDEGIKSYQLLSQLDRLLKADAKPDYSLIQLYATNDFDVTQYDAVEVHPCVFVQADAVEQCEPDEADFWSIYLHQKQGGLMCLADCPDEKTATFFSKQFSAMLSLEIL